MESESGESFHDESSVMFHSSVLNYLLFLSGLSMKSVEGTKILGSQRTASAAVLLSILVLGMMTAVGSVSSFGLSHYCPGSTSNPDGSTNACSNQKLSAEMADAGNPSSPQSIQSFASGSTQYSAAASGYNSTYTGFANEFNIDQVNCSVSWRDAAANFLLQSGTSKYVLVVAENPNLGIVYSVVKHGYASASAINPTSSPTQSGYYVANDSSSPHTTAVDYVAADWYLPTLSTPPSGQD